MPAAWLQFLRLSCCLIAHAAYACMICSNCGNGHCHKRRARRVRIPTGVASALSGSASGSSSPQSASAVALSACLPGSSFLLRDLHEKMPVEDPGGGIIEMILEFSFAPETLRSG